MGEATGLSMINSKACNGGNVVTDSMGSVGEAHTQGEATYNLMLEI